jgi:hypothetical protein
MKNHQETPQGGLLTSPAPGLAALLGKSLDYAGMFPPAGLNLEAAVRRLASYLSGPEAWILSRFVCPAGRLKELEALLHLFPEQTELRVSALAASRSAMPEWQAGLKETVSSVHEFQRRAYPRARVDSVEISLPPELAAGEGAVKVPELIDLFADSLGAAGIRGVTVFYEATADWGGLSGVTMEAIAAHNSGAAVPAAFKLRTGGLTAEEVPAIDRVAYTIATCRELGIPFKCTAGLHHPVRGGSELPGVKMHGFLNVFVAAVLAHGPSGRGMDLRTVLTEEDTAQFRFDQTGLSWRDSAAPLSMISAARRELLLSFGSCSVEEPLRELKSLGLL